MGQMGFLFVCSPGQADALGAQASPPACLPIMAAIGNAAGEEHRRPPLCLLPIMAAIGNAAGEERRRPPSTYPIMDAIGNSAGEDACAPSTRNHWLAGSQIRVLDCAT